MSHSIRLGQGILSSDVVCLAVTSPQQTRPKLRFDCKQPQETADCLMHLLCSIGVISEKEPPDEETKSKKAAKEAELGVQKCKVFGMEIKALTQQDEPRAVESGEKAVNPTNVQQYLARAFGGRYFTSSDLICSSDQWQMYTKLLKQVYAANAFAFASMFCNYDYLYCEGTSSTKEGCAASLVLQKESPCCNTKHSAL